MTAPKNNYLLGLDVGERRVGVALASRMARLARPLTVLPNDESLWDEIVRLVKTENVGTVVIGLPRSLAGSDTAQTRSIRNFAARLREKLDAEIVLQDEALTSRQAEAELRGRGKQFAKGDIDALAATYILEDYLGTMDRAEPHL